MTFENQEKEPAPVIREFREEDILPYLTMHRRSWLDTYPNLEIGLSKEKLELIMDQRPIEARANRLRDMIKNGDMANMSVLYLGEVLVGATEVLMENIDGENYGKIKMVYLDPDYIGQGFGAKLMNFALEKLESMGARKFVVEAANYNQRAINFYRKFGFDEVHQIENFALSSDFSIPQIRMFKR